MINIAIQAVLGFFRNIIWTKFKISLLLNIVLVGAIFFLLRKPDQRSNIIGTTIKYDTITQVINNTKPIQIKKIKIKVPFETIITNNITDTITKIVYKNIETSEYKYKDILSNGIIEETILADKIYKRDVKLTTFDKTITNTVLKSQFYLGGTTTLDFNKSVVGVSLGAFYTHKNNFLLGVGVGTDFKQPNVNITLAIKL